MKLSDIEKLTLSSKGLQSQFTTGDWAGWPLDADIYVDEDRNMRYVVLRGANKYACQELDSEEKIDKKDFIEFEKEEGEK